MEVTDRPTDHLLLRGQVNDDVAIASIMIRRHLRMSMGGLNCVSGCCNFKEEGQKGGIFDRVGADNEVGDMY